MFQKILVPLDSSPRAEQALSAAMRIARASSGKVVLLRVVNAAHADVINLAQGSEMSRTIGDEDLKEARQYLTQIAGSDSLGGARIEMEVMRGQAIPAILSAVNARQIDLIVMCSHGYSGMKRWTIGSVAEQVAHLAPVPTLLLREGGALTTGAFRQSEGPLRILVPLDGSAQAEAAILPSAQLVTALSAPAASMLHLVRVVVLSDEAEISHSEREEIVQTATQYLSATADRIRERLVARSQDEPAPTITWSITLDDDIAAGIVRVAEEGEETGEAGVGRSDIIAMTTRGQSGLQQRVLGSATERVLDATRLPLLLVRPLKP